MFENMKQTNINRKNRNISISKVLNNFFLHRKCNNFVGNNFQGVGHFKLFVEPNCLLFSHNPFPYGLSGF